MSFANIVGHEGAIRLLTGQLGRQRLASTYLLVGLKGIGKKRLALELAKALHCQAKDPAGACDQCEICQKISKGTHPDVLMVSPESETAQIGIDQIRTVAHWISLTPHSGTWKVGLIDAADHLTEEAAHACLKLLEEPPPHSLLILTASSANRLPHTFVSRCFSLRCAPQGIQRVASFLREKEKCDSTQALRLALLSGGRLGIALRLKEEGVETKEAALTELLGARREKLVEIPLGNAPRAELEEALEWFASWWRDLLVLKLGGKENLLILRERLPELQAAGCESFTVEMLLKQLDRTLKAHEAVERNASPRIALATLLSG